MPLTWQTFETGVREFHRLPSLLMGERDAILIDGGFLRSTGKRQVDAIRASGKTLKAIMVTCFDPDFYFGLTPVRAAFPDVPVLAHPSIVEGINATAQLKLDFWQPQLGDEAPATIGDVVIPARHDAPTIALEHETIEIVVTPQQGYVHLWLPSQRLIFGGVQVSSNNHVWMADEQRPGGREAWKQALDDMIALDPIEVLPGHLPPGAPTGPGTLRFTRAYIEAFEEELAKAENAAGLITAMTARYPDLAMDFILDLGAKVCMGEQPWP